MADQQNTDQASFKEMMDELNQINDQLKRLDPNDLDRALELYEKGMHLVIACKAKLNEFDEKVKRIDAGNAGNGI